MDKHYSFNNRHLWQQIELSKLSEGDILEVLLAEGEPLENVPRNAKEQGYNVLSVEHVEGTTHRVTIKK